jgi:hypothetical protein
LVLLLSGIWVHQEVEAPALAVVEAVVVEVVAPALAGVEAVVVEVVVEARPF